MASVLVGMKVIGESQIIEMLNICRVDFRNDNPQVILKQLALGAMDH